MQYKNLLSTLILASSVAAQAAADAPTNRAQDLMHLQMTMDAIPPATLQKLKDLPEEMMQHEAKALHFLGMQEIAAGAALMHRGMNLLAMEVQMELAHGNGTMQHHPVPHLTEGTPSQPRPPVMPAVIDEPKKEQGEAPATPANTPAPDRGEAQGSTRGFETVVRSNQGPQDVAADEDEEAYVP